MAKAIKCYFCNIIRKELMPCAFCGKMMCLFHSRTKVYTHKAYFMEDGYDLEYLCPACIDMVDMYNWINDVE